MRKARPRNMRRLTFLALLSRAIALRPPGRRPKPTAKPFAPDTDALDDFFTQLDPDALVAVAPVDDAPAAPLCVVPPSAGPLHLFGDE